MTIRQTIKSTNRPAHIWTLDIDQASLNQLKNVASMPFIFRHVAAMPDVHLGKGATIGSVIPTKGAIMPAAVGVDIGCGMTALRLDMVSAMLPGDLAGLRESIEAAVPRGGPGIVGSWGDSVPCHVLGLWKQHLYREYRGIRLRYPPLGKGLDIEQLGTLGGGNHFIEICIDEEDRVWIVVHSGSRGPGNRIGRFFTDKAKQQCAKWFIELPDPDLAYLVDYYDYMTCMNWAIKYASISRKIMVDAVVRTLGHAEHDNAPIDCIHNYAAMENHFGNNILVTRKGAIRARVGDMGVIPGSMGEESYIVHGKGEQASFCSAAHGAGRAMSRTVARREFTVSDLVEQTEGIECSKDESHIDEIPGAYKDIKCVMDDQSDLVDIVHALHPVVNVKGVM